MHAGLGSTDGVSSNQGDKRLLLLESVLTHLQRPAAH
jgi:hypothetical protein